MTSIDGRSGPTIIPDKVTLSGSIRFSDPNLEPELHQLIQQITCDTAKAYGVEAVVTFQKRYGPTINHAAQAEFARQQWQQISPKVDFNVLPAMPLMASEDFSDYLKVVPGAFALIGTGEAGKSSSLPQCAI